MMTINRVEQKKNKWSTVPIDDNEDQSEFEFSYKNTRFYNYQFMYNDDWQPLNLEEWGRAESLEELNLRLQQVVPSLVEKVLAGKVYFNKY